MTKNLVIVESPAKAKTIGGFLGKEFTVKSCMGHVTDLTKKGLGVDIEKGFQPKYIISPEKKKVVTELKKIADESELVWLASDEDREGEAISWHLFEALGLSEIKTRRIAFHEITRPAIQKAIENPRAIDRNLVYAQQARRVMDRLVGFELSPLLWKKIKPSLSAGRVQSVAVRLIVEREEEIRNFVSVSSFRITGDFPVKNGTKSVNVKAELNRRFQEKSDAAEFLKKCIISEFIVEDVDTRPARKSPSPPFTTSTLQQEASRKLGFSVSNTMRVAQELYEAGLITYMRTDSVNLSDLALSMAKEEITSLFGNNYVKTRNYTTRTKGAQEAHEAIRPTYLNNKTIDGDRSRKRLYELIWKRTIASQMADAELEKTVVTIGVSNSVEKFIAKGEVIRFEGFLKVYMESSDEDEQTTEEGVLPPIYPEQKLTPILVSAQEKFTQQPFRYTEATLVKKLEELGIGRPSTYAPIISTIQKREYVVREDRPGYSRNYTVINLQKGKLTEEILTEIVGNEKGKLSPTDIGGLVNSFLIQYFQNIMDYHFTARVEEEFDEIAQGKLVWNEMIRNFYEPFHRQIDLTLESSKKVSGEKLIGHDPLSGSPVYVKIGRYGPMVQIGDAEDEKKPRFAGLKKGQSIETLTLEDALELFKLPRIIGEVDEAEVLVASGRFGPYIKHKSQYFTIPKSDDPLNIELPRAIEIMEAKKLSDSQKILSEFRDGQEVISVLNGKYGAYISFNRENYKIPKSLDPRTLSLEDCRKIINEGQPTKSKSIKKK